MMQAINRFVDLSAEAVAQGVRIDAINALPIMRQLRRMGEDIGGDEQPEQFEALRRALDAAFTQLMREAGADAR